jgi:urea transporter
MNTTSAPELNLADYDDAPNRRTGNPLIRLVRAAGGMLTVLAAGLIAALLALHIEPPPGLFDLCVIASVASIPLIALVWAREVRWKPGWATVLTIGVIALLTWFVEVLLSVAMVVLVVVISK